MRHNNLLRPYGSLLIVASMFLAPSVHATIIEFTDWQQAGADQVIPTWSVDDTPDDEFKVTVGIDSGSPNTGYFTGLFFDLSDDLECSDVNAPGVVNCDEDTSKINGVTNIGPVSTFHIALGYPNNTYPAPTYMFWVSDLGGLLTLDDWSRVGVRWQSVAADQCPDTDPNCGSDKEWSGTTTTRITKVPEPGTLSLLGIGLLGLALVRRRPRLYERL